MARTPLADWLYRFRFHHLQKTQADFARDLGMSMATIQAWEYGRHQPSGAALVLLARLAQEHGYEPPPDVDTGRGPRARKE
jgi:transcriptional regulator with XRE-family HTH domain